VGYKWGGTPSLYMGGGCAIGPFKDTAGIASLRAGGAPRTFRLSAGPAFTVLRFVGDGAPPLVEVTGPGGVVMTTPTVVDAEVQRGGTAVVIRDPTTNTTFVQFRPETGTYTAVLQPGSVAVTGATTSESLPSPSITASVSGRGTRRVLRWRATRIAGQQLTFTVRGAAGLREITTTNATSGSKRFTVPAGLPGISTVSARVRQDGFDRATLDVASFSAPVARPPKAPRGLSIQRKGLTARIRWAKVAGAVSYAVQVSTTGGARSVTTQQQPSLVLPRTLPSDTVAVQVTALDASGQRSASATRTSQGRAASACLAPAKVTVVLKARSSLSSAVALLNGRPAAANRTGAKRLSVPLAGITGRKATLVVKARTRSGRAIAGRHVYALCAGRTVPARLVLPLR
uniref:hypothetical protein n=1 Tax=Paraconexibacter sp. TaxID=2949640 RepID=UPI0035643DE0